MEKEKDFCLDDIISLVPESAKGYIELTIQLSKALNEISRLRARVSFAEASRTSLLKQLISRAVSNSYSDSFYREYEKDPEYLNKSPYNNPFTDVIKMCVLAEIPSSLYNRLIEEAIYQKLVEIKKADEEAALKAAKEKKEKGESK